MNNIFSLTLYLLAIINPISKIFILSTISGEYSWKKIRVISLKASTIAFFVLLIFTVTGNIVFKYIFHVELYAFKITAGIIVFVIGFRALSKGIYFESSSQEKLSEFIMVPLVSPMIAGPGSIATVITFSAQHGVYVAFAAIFFALLINLLMMLASGVISRVFNKYHLMGALIRMSGMIVATIAVQMVISGISDWWKIMAIR